MLLLLLMMKQLIRHLLLFFLLEKNVESYEDRSVIALRYDVKEGGIKERTNTRQKTIMQKEGWMRRVKSNYRVQSFLVLLISCFLCSQSCSSFASSSSIYSCTHQVKCGVENISNSIRLTQSWCLVSSKELQEEGIASDETRRKREGRDEK